ncbi:MAG TPA: TlpA disulfide reductase family protein [Puia sp.]|jgi:thiol-disulfide isomerase/thioredoxin|nr:TlpA disulfide reductase family protein [Puia sp.]
MKYFLLITVFSFCVFSVQAQEIKKIKVTDLETYIAHCDHPLIVNFWATYCGPCIKEIPYFEKLAAQHKDKHVELLLVSVDMAEYYPAKIIAFVKEHQFVSPVWWLNETNADYFCPKVDKSWTGGIPSTLLVNNETRYRKFFERQLTELQMEEYIRALLK